GRRNRGSAAHVADGALTRSECREWALAMSDYTAERALDSEFPREPTRGQKPLFWVLPSRRPEGGASTDRVGRQPAGVLFERGTRVNDQRRFRYDYLIRAIQRRQENACQL